MKFNIENSIALKLSNTLNFLRKRFNKAIKKYNISSEQYAILNLINQKEWTPTQLSEIVNKDKAAITRFINSLEKRGLIKKEDINKRSYKIVITEEGQNILKEVDKIAADFREKIEKRVSKEKIELLFKILEEIEKSIKD
jgi:DNA-binding MarR family transcriptional regulator